jgi:hypothetical protein
MMDIVGVSGNAQSGKDTCADVLVEQYGFTKVSFADGVREFMVRLDPVLHFGGMETALLSEHITEGGTPEQWAWLKENSDAREHMVAIGAGAREIMGEDVWIRAALAKMERAPWTSFVLPDCRYANEARMIRGMGGEVWRIARPGVEPANDEEAHSLSEFNGDTAIFNGGSMGELQSYVDSLMKLRWIGGVS